ncbi:MAG TPA: RecQ family ATP-dependent DNA helicase [Vicinamibacterales bacterium]
MTAIGSQMPALRRTLRQVFAHDDLRPGQLDVIRSVLSGRPTLAIMPTGAGKSLCYQLPGLHLPGMTIVVSPLIALMKDQSDKLSELGVVVSQINSALDGEEARTSLERLERGETEFLLTTPEQLATPALIARLRGRRLDLFVIDEAHCISQWGHDFRPAYLALRDAIRALDHPPVLALTATATPDVVRDIAMQLDLPGLHVIHSGTYRENLHLSVVHPTSGDEKDEALVSWVRSMEGTGIVYTATVKHVEHVTARLRDAGLAVAPYHGRLAARRRREEQDRFMDGELKAVVATNAFGMGIDKPDIRFVLHYDLPGTLEAYYQEAGRAGRDGDAARCLLLYRREDERVQTFFASGRYPTRTHIERVVAALHSFGDTADGHTVREVAERSPDVPRTRVQVVLSALDEAGFLTKTSRGSYEPDGHWGALDPAAIADGFAERTARDRDKLSQMVAWAQTARCRWRVLLDYFGEPLAERCGTCDNCRDRPDVA